MIRSQLRVENPSNLPAVQYFYILIKMAVATALTAAVAVAVAVVLVDGFETCVQSDILTSLHGGLCDLFYYVTNTF